MLVFVTTKPKCSQKNKTHKTEHGKSSTRTSTREKTKKKNTGGRKKQSNKQQAAKNTAKAEYRNSFTSVALRTTRCRRKNRGKIKKDKKTSKFKSELNAWARKVHRYDRKMTSLRLKTSSYVRHTIGTSRNREQRVRDASRQRWKNNSKARNKKKTTTMKTTKTWRRRR